MNITLNKCFTDLWEIAGLYDFEGGVVAIVSKQDLEQLKDLITAALQDNDLQTKGETQ